MVIESQPDSKFLFSSIYYTDARRAVHIRRVFNLFDLLGAMGGILEIFIMTFGIIFFPMSKQSFIISAL